jgi:hypothetical protein
MGVEPMTYGFFGVYKAVALPLSYRGECGAFSGTLSKIKSLSRLAVYAGGFAARILAAARTSASTPGRF